MLNVLQIDSARNAGSQSRPLTAAVVERLKASQPEATITVHDVQRDPLPYLDDEIVGAFFTPSEQRSAVQQAIVDRSDALIDAWRAADVVVIGAPMYNFHIPAQLKTYFDWITRAGVTFRYRADGTPEGLLQGKRAIVVTTRGGAYDGTPADHLSPYLTMLLNFLGVANVTVVPVENLARGGEAVTQALQQARAKIAELA